MENSIQIVHREALRGNVSFRFGERPLGLNAFKVLGGSWCIGRYIAQKLGILPEELTCERLENIF